MALRWFRRRAREEQTPADDSPAAPATPDSQPDTQPVAAAPSAEGAGEARPRRRRGSRGGRGRRGSRRPAQADASDQAQEKAERLREEAEAACPQALRTDSRRKQPTRRAPLPAAKRELLVSVDVTEQAVAVLEDDRVAEVYLERPGRRSIAGNIYKGVVDNVLPGDGQRSSRSSRRTASSTSTRSSARAGGSATAAASRTCSPAARRSSCRRSRTR